MESKSSSGCSSIFVTLTTITGFLVDIVTLINFFSTFRLRNVIDTQSVLGFSKTNIAYTSLNWKDVMFVVIVYFLFALIAYISINSYHTEKSAYGTSISVNFNYSDITQISVSEVGLNLLILTIFLWVIIFFFPYSVLWQYILYILEGWGLGVILSLLAWRWTKEQNEVIIKNFSLMIVVSLPAVILMNELLFNTGFFLSTGITLILGLSSIVYAILANILLFIFVESIVSATQRFR